MLEPNNLRKSSWYLDRFSLPTPGGQKESIERKNALFRHIRKCAQSRANGSLSEAPVTTSAHAQ